MVESDQIDSDQGQTEVGDLFDRAGKWCLNVGYKLNGKYKQAWGIPDKNKFNVP